MCMYERSGMGVGSKDSNVIHSKKESTNHKGKPNINNETLKIKIKDSSDAIARVKIVASTKIKQIQ